MIKAVGLDLDDTLYDRNQVYEKTLHAMEQDVVTTGVSFQEFNEVFQEESQNEFQKFTQGLKGETMFKVDRVLSTYERLNHSIKYEQALKFNELYLKYKEQIELRPGMEKLLNHLLNTDMELFVLTNGAKETQASKMDYLGIDKWVSFEKRFISDEVGMAKPDKGVFDLVEAALGLVGDEILYIGDHYENDILGSLKNDWTAVHYDVNNERAGVEGIAQFSTDLEVYEYVKNLLV